MVHNFSPSPPSVTSSNGSFPPLPQGSPWLESEDSEWDLGRWFAVARRRGVVIVGVTVTGISFVIPRTLNEEPSYQSKFRILVEPVNAENDLGNLTPGLGNQNIKSSLDYQTQIQVLRSPELMEVVLAEVQKTYPEISYNSLIGNLKITRLGKTKILEISYQGNDPDLILTILEQLAKVYLNYSLNERQTNLRQGIQFIENQLPSLQARVNELQNQLQAFRERYQFTNPDSQAELIASQITALKQENLALEQQLAKSRFNLGSLQEETGAVAALSEAPLYQQIIGQLREVETQIAAELTRFQAQSTAIRLLQNQRQNLLPILEQEAERILGSKLAEAVTEVQRLETQRQTLLVAQQQLKQQAQQMPALTRQYTDLELEIQIATEGLNRFRATWETLQIEAAQTEIPWEVIEAPVRPVAPISPNIQRSITLGAVASLAVGIGVALILEKLDNVYHTALELKQQTKLHLLGNIPINKQIAATPSNNSLAKVGGLLSKPFTWLIPALKQKSTPYIYYGDSQSSHFLEALRVLYTNIQLLSSDRPIRSLAISSALPGDGKSTIAIYLAQTAAAIGKKVLLVDADLRKPQVHPRLQLSNQLGLSNLILQTLSPEDVIEQKLPVAGLSVLTSGQLVPDPTKLIYSHKMTQLMAGFHETFDLVIYDTPSVLGLADATLLTPHTDGLILVTRVGKTYRSALTQALENLKLSQIQVLGIVANGVKGDSLSPYKYYKSGYKGNPQQQDMDEEENLTPTLFK
ncbi:polysaccharide biosynthesis tyrosine autokinase [Moorena producens JHB]|uniref:non-specific protein-tyrosine kinase n=1 Tax=Moorena producens (strain JHB) TaxID=1454205 RepID=A0A1D9GBL8_MOOP1|nr:polysaccharide biosynthesis tyrosine autokinase [Moorena producens]AOY85003.2 polysaccharide biosynthesis tyrosine autokinase [Moorena producens JHB]